MNTTELRHYSLQGPFAVDGPHLVIGGTRLVDIVAQCGKTPLYLYSRDIIRNRIRELRKLLPTGVRLHYAVKANPMQAVVDLIAQNVDGLDVASGRELGTALRSGMPSADISFAGPGKSEQELADAIAAGITLNVESDTEFARIAEISRTTGRTANVALRINPDFELRTSGIKVSGGPQPFGVDAETAPALLEKIAASGMHFMGFHIFSGSQTLRAETIIEVQEKTFALAGQLSEHAGMPVRRLNIGGGFGIPYFPGDTPLEVRPVMENLKTLLERYHEKFARTEIVLELGRYLVGEAGLYVMRITDRKISRGTLYLVCDGGLHHHLAASGNFGQAIRRNYPVTIGNRIGERTENVSVVGPLCTSLDILAKDMDLPKADIGDLVVVFQSGAYGYTASPLNFLSHPEPSEILV